MNLYYVTNFNGLSDVVRMELKSLARLDVREILRWRGGEMVFIKTGEPGVLMRMRTIEDVFALLGRATLSGSRDDLKLMGKVPAFSQNLSQALSIRAATLGRLQSGRQRFRVIVQARDASWRQYRRADIQAAAEGAIMRSHPTWRLSADAPVEIWLTQADHELVIGLRLSDSAMRQRGGRATERAAALRPSIAAAMVYLSEPEDDDIFLDPMCGSGTILLERAEVGRYQMLMGGDIDPAAVKATLANFGRRHQPRQIEQWDVGALPLDDASIDKIACNLPWGRQVGDITSLPDLYRRVLKESVRVLRPGGTLVVLTSEGKILRRAGDGLAGLAAVRTVGDVDVLGAKAEITVFERTRRLQA